MKKRYFCWLLMIALTLLFAGPQAIAKDKVKKGYKDSPAGWEKGKKKGWEGDAPPRHDKEASKELDKKKKEKMKDSEEMEREEQKRHEEMEREDRKHDEEIEQEDRKDNEEREHEDRKDSEKKLKGQKNKKDKDQDDDDD